MEGASGIFPGDYSILILGYPACLGAQELGCAFTLK